MSLYGVLRTGVSGMNAQSNLLGTVADNIANSGTTGYKRASVEFSSLLLQSGHGNYSSGAVVSEVRHSISDRGPLAYTTSDTDLAIQGDGFFVVNDATGTPYLTRAGSFTLDGSSGNLVNSAGYTLMGYDLSGGAASGVLNGYANLVPINMSSMTMRAAPSTIGEFMANLPYKAAPVTGDLPSANLGTSTYSEKASILAYDNVGNEVTLDIYMTKTATSPDTWEYSVFDQSQATSGGFPYASGPLTTANFTFDATGKLSGATSFSFTVPNGQTLTMDITGTTQLAESYTPVNVGVDGNAPASLDGITISDDGVVYANYSNGAVTPTFRLPLADVPSPDKLKVLPGNVFAVTPDSGDVRIGFPNEAGLGSMVSGALEQSNVDMASELTEMIVAQRDYTANSKVFQTGSELLEVLMNLKR
ncbi:flagellar hook protein FlgE [Afifella sp. IM 167]|uniref:flagellar hook protein FlgE n=1 Tax=Afifella sp. IM 167 TaxID=2033586 RepID=UPI001CCFB20B|nr:flagellar hook protein FlgE [Afifella sp. IM 167]MBZ8131797.1 flagellar hook protein FlgE [Afifella sp. IM 167]